MMQNLSGIGGLIYSVLSYVLVSLGYWQIFRKCGIKQIWSLIPILREYQIAKCAEREDDGIKYAALSGLSYVISLAMRSIDNGYSMRSFLLILFLGVEISVIVYNFRIYLGLTSMFNRSKKWVFLFVLFEAVAVMIWGFSPKFMPYKKVGEGDEETGAEELGKDIANISDGLTINIRERTVMDMLKKKTLIKDIHMHIPTGHMVLLLGGSGAGKTTFLNAITGYEQANAEIKLGDDDVYKEYSQLMYDIGFVPQQDLMRTKDMCTLTLTDAAGLRLPKNIVGEERKKRVDAVLEQFGLTAVKNSLVEKLSGGQKKRLSIAMELISDPTLFILDEPDSGLDGIVARRLFESLRAIADEGKIVIVITHTPDRVVDLFDDVIVLAKDASRTGRLAWYGPVNEAYEFFGKDSMEGILRSINQKDEGGEGRADEYVEKYTELMKEKVG